jgi:hypothetical protein
MKQYTYGNSHINIGICHKLSSAEFIVANMSAIELPLANICVSSANN